MGATGLTGNALLKLLVRDDRYGKIKLFSRSSTGIQHEKIEEHLVDLFKLEDLKEHFKAEEVFCCIGTTQSKTPNKETYHKVDYGIPVSAAKLSKENGITTFAVISALGADAGSKMFYNKTKGEMERDVLAKGIKNTYIFQPSLIAGDREEKRSMEKIAQNVMKVMNPLMLGPLKKYRSIHPQTIANAMVKAANSKYNKTHILSDEIQKIGGEQQ